MENQQTKKALTRTFGVTYYGEDANENKALSVDYLESNLKISIHRPSGGGDYAYDYKSGNEIYLREKKAKVLSRFIKKAIDAKNNGQDFAPLSVDSGANLIEVSFGSHHGCNSDICITIYNDINAETKKCNNYAVFGFRNSSAVMNYDATNGTYDSIPIDSDVNYFVDQLTEFAKAGTGAYSHMNKKEFKFDMDRIISRQLDVCAKLGIKHENPNSNRLSWNNSSSDNGGAISLDTADILDEIG